MADRTRYQILFTVPKGQKEPPVENFTAAQRKSFLWRVKTLKAQGVTFTTWDTQKNAMSSLFRF